MKTSPNEIQLRFLIEFMTKAVDLKVVLNQKLLRDTLDVVEGLMRHLLNSKGQYDHSSLKHQCSYRSKKVHALKNLSKEALLKKTHREHAIPIQVVIAKLYEIKKPTPQKVLQFLQAHLISVLILKEEQKVLDSSKLNLKKSMPLDWDGLNALARFEKAGIYILATKS